MPNDHIEYIKTDFLKNIKQEYLNSISKEKKTESTENIDTQVEAYYLNKTGRHLADDALQYYRYTNGMTLDETVNLYLKKDIHGIYIPGANYDPKAEFCSNDHSKTPPDIRRENFERIFIKKAIEKGIPILGICSSTWLLSSLFKGGKSQALSGEALQKHAIGPQVVIDETKIHPSRLSQHAMTVKPSTILYSIMKYSDKWESIPSVDGSMNKKLKLKLIPNTEDKQQQLTIANYDQQSNITHNVNSTHWRTVKPQLSVIDLANINSATTQNDKVNIVLNARVDDDDQMIISAIDPEHLTVEGIETTHGAPVLGVQPHPEARLPYLQTSLKKMEDPDYPANRRILEALIESATAYAIKKIAGTFIKANLFTLHATQKDNHKPNNAEKNSIVENNKGIHE